MASAIYGAKQCFGFTSFVKTTESELSTTTYRVLDVVGIIPIIGGIARFIINNKFRSEVSSEDDFDGSRTYHHDSDRGFYYGQNIRAAGELIGLGAFFIIIDVIAAVGRALSSCCNESSDNRFVVVED